MVQMYGWRRRCPERHDRAMESFVSNGEVCNEQWRAKESITNLRRGRCLKFLLQESLREKCDRAMGARLEIEYNGGQRRMQEVVGGK